MRFKTYIGTHTDLSRLIGEAQHELGPEAVIKTEYFTEGGFFGIGARKMVRVTAGVEEHPGESPFSIVARAIAAAVPSSAVASAATAEDSPWHPAPSPGVANGKPTTPPPAVAPPVAIVAEEKPLVPADDVPGSAADDEPVEAYPLDSEPPVEAPAIVVVTDNPAQAELPFTSVVPPMAALDGPGPVPPPMESAHSDVLQAVLAELKALRGEVDALRHDVPTGGEAGAALQHLSAPLQTLYRTLIDRELSPGIARHIVEEVESGLEAAGKASGALVAQSAITSIVTHCLATREDTGPLSQTGPRVLMLIGPTGVGKTTTLAKLAAAFHLVDDQKVALITADTYRIGAIDQLRTFAQIINLPLDVVFDPTEFSKALALNDAVQLVLVDTAGRSPKDELRLTELKRFLAVDHPVETLLVVTATTKAPDLRLILDRFGELGLDGLIITKLDETSAIGPIIELLWDTRLPVRFLANGQNVPDDLVRADEGTLLRRLAEQLVL